MREEGGDEEQHYWVRNASVIYFFIFYHWFLFPTTDFEVMNLHSVPFVVVILKVLGIMIGGSSLIHQFMI